MVGLGVGAAALAPALQLALQPYSYVAGAIAYLLVLTVLGVGLWIGFRLTRGEFGWRWGRLSDHAIALAYPVLAIGGLAAFALARGAAADELALAPITLLRDIAIMAAATFVGVLLTEEGFFRGALWGAAVRAGWGAPGVVAWTTACFVAWHAAVPFVDANYHVPASALPMYFANVGLLGVAWGLLRLGSGSLLVACLAHAIWNGLSYNLFGYGAEAGALGVAAFDVYGPERGLAGLAANGAAALALAAWARARTKST